MNQKTTFMVAAAASALVVTGTGCSSIGIGPGSKGSNLQPTSGSTAEDPTKGETTKGDTSKEESGIPALPALETIEDPGTVDRLLGAFPVGDARDIQYAWLEYSDSGRQFISRAREAETLLVDNHNDDRAADEAPVAAVLDQVSDSAIYYRGVYACVWVMENYPLASLLERYADAYAGVLAELVDVEVGPENVKADRAVVFAANEYLCPEIDPVISDFDYRIETPLMLRTTLGVGANELEDDLANQFANWVCNEIGRGETESRLSTMIADKFGYPDETADTLIKTIAVVTCD